MRDADRPAPGFSILMAITMAAATVLVNGVGVLAPELISEFGISRAQVGGTVTAFGVIATILSLPAGRLTDRIGGKRALIGVYLFSVVSIATLAMAADYWMLLAALGLAGAANSAANPGTNRLIGALLPPGRRGVVAGVKMSGVQAGVFVSGLALPLGFEWLGWRPTVALLAAIPLVGLVWMYRAVPDVRPAVGDINRAPLPRSVFVLAGYTFLMSAAAAASVTYLPLFGIERLAMSPASAGGAVALSGVVAVGGRIVWGVLTERTTAPTTNLWVLALGSAAAMLALIAAESAGTGLVWAGAALIGGTASSYNSAATMALLRLAPIDQTGRASGVVFTGFLGGIGVGPLVAGFILDKTESYDTAWWVLAGTFLVAATVIALARVRAPFRRDRVQP